MSTLMIKDVSESKELSTNDMESVYGGAKKSKSSGKSDNTSKTGAVEAGSVVGSVFVGDDGDVTEDYALSQLYYSSLWGIRV